MIMRFNPGKLDDTLVRLRRNSVVLADGGQGGLELTTSAVRVTSFQVAESGKSLETEVTLRFEKDRASVLVSLNPELLKILGYAPGIQSVISSNSWPKAGDLVSVALSDKLTVPQIKSVEDLGWLLDLHVVPVGLP
jgi:hypothetical protein